MTLQVGDIVEYYDTLSNPIKFRGKRVTISEIEYNHSDPSRHLFCSIEFPNIQHFFWRVKKIDSSSLKKTSGFKTFQRKHNV